MIVDEMTWRVLSWRRYSEGLHQAIEAKENVEIQQESRTLASITFQNYFRMFFKLAGMTWTAKTEEEEFYKVYGLDVIVVPTNKPVIREDKADLLFKSEEGKYDYLVDFIKELNETWRPILVGTVSVVKSEYLSKKLEVAGLKHNVLNAKHHDKEAEIVANAWEKWAITIATNMAGRWTDIKLSDEVKELGGLIIIWTEKHESRRIDNQLRGRSGRQGDPWMTQFLISPTDDIMRIFGWEKLFSVFNSPMFASIPANEPLAESGMLTRRITSVQKQVEWHHFDIRKHVLEYDDVINQHRDIIYTRRNKILDSENIDADVIDMIKSQVEKAVMAEASEIVHADTLWEIREKLNDFLNIEFITESDLEEDSAKNIEDIEDLKEYVTTKALEKFDEIKSKFEDEEAVLELERRLVLQSIDELWMMHIDAMSRLRQDVAFAWYAQKNPLIVYKWKAYDKFVELLDEVEFKVTKALFMATPKTEVEVINMPEGVELTEEQAQELIKQAQEMQKNIQSNNVAPKNSNPLFVNPNSAPKNDTKKKYRV
jgi:preprotein translocase subunit SecA